METLDISFKERLLEIDEYLELLAAIEGQIQEGVPRLGASGPVVTVAQQRILYSSVYLQLYNLIEATINRCIEAICDAVSKDGQWYPVNLSKELREEWVRYIAKTHSDLNYQNRLERSMELCNHLIRALPVERISITKGGGGNWDDKEISKLAKRIGCELSISTTAYKAVKKPFKNDKGALALIVQLRNDLAHGSLSFVECGDGVTSMELKELKIHTANYLQEVLDCFKTYITTYQFLHPDSRPIGLQA